MDGTIDYTSGLNEGTTFVVDVRLPYSTSEEGAVSLDTDQTICKGRRILLVDTLPLTT